MTFADQHTAARFRDWARGVIVKEINKLMPPDRFGVVQAVDTGARTVDIIFSGETDERTYPYYGSNPSTSDTVRVTGRANSRYVIN